MQTLYFFSLIRAQITEFLFHDSIPCSNIKNQKCFETFRPPIVNLHRLSGWRISLNNPAPGIFLVSLGLQSNKNKCYDAWFIFRNIRVKTAPYGHISHFYGAERFCRPEKIGATDGNLGRQMEILAAHGFVGMTKNSIGKRVRTTYALSGEGRETFVHYVEELAEIIGGDAKSG